MTSRHEITLSGGRPWGFALQGGVDHHSILRVGRVTPGSKAYNSGLKDGDVFITINGQDCRELKHIEAQQVIKSAGQTLALVVDRGNVTIKPGTSTSVKPSPPPQVVPDGAAKTPTTPTTPPSPKPSLPPKPIISRISPPRSQPAQSSTLSTQTQKPPPPKRTTNQRTTNQESQPDISRTRGSSKNWYKELMKTLHEQDDTTEVVIPMSGTREQAAEKSHKPKPKTPQAPHQQPSKQTTQQSPKQTTQQPSKQPTQQPPKQPTQQPSQPPPKQPSQPPPKQPSQPPKQPSQQPSQPPPKETPSQPSPVVGSFRPTPPVTKPAVSQPPVTKPAVSQPPVTKPVVSQPPVTKPVVSQPPVATPPVSQPPVATPPVVATSTVPPSSEKMPSALDQQVDDEYNEMIKMKKLEEEKLNYLEEQIAADLKDLADSVREQSSSPVRLDPDPEQEPDTIVMRFEQEPFTSLELEPEPEPYQQPVSLKPETEAFEETVRMEPQPEPEPYQPPEISEPEPQQQVMSLDPEPEPEPEPQQPIHWEQPVSDKYVGEDSTLQKMHPLIAQEMVKEAQRESSPGRITGDFSSLEELTAPGRHMPKEGTVQTHRQPEPEPQTAPKEKKHKPPPGETARALFDFSASNTREVSFQKDDVLKLIRTVNEDWLEGEVNGVSGLVPMAYIEVLSGEETTLPPPVEFEETMPSVRGKFKFEPMSERELSFDVDDVIRLTRVINDDWLEGTLEGRKGIFPTSFIDVIHPLPGMKVAEPEVSNKQNPETVAQDEPVKEAELQQDDVEITVQAGGDGKGVSISELKESLSGMEGKRYQVVYEYEPTNADEVEILENDTVMVYVECDDGWFLGVNERTLKFGTFPGNYVQLID